MSQAVASYSDPRAAPLAERVLSGVETDAAPVIAGSHCLPVGAEISVHVAELVAAFGCVEALGDLVGVDSCVLPDSSVATDPLVAEELVEPAGEPDVDPPEDAVLGYPAAVTHVD